MNFTDLLEAHPEIAADRHSLTFSRRERPTEIVEAYRRAGVVLLKDALPAPTLDACAASFGRFVEGETSDSWHSPWAVCDGPSFPVATVLAAVIRSWVWDVVEDLCGSSFIVVLLKWCTTRHAVDRALGVGGHQDAKVVAADVPFSIWIPLTAIIPRRGSGLGFVVPAPDRLLPTSANDDIGADYVLRDPGRLWMPSYSVGDLSIHSRYAPHFTTGFGSLSDRFSMEIRAMPRHGAPPEYIDPAIFVSRQGGIPTIVGARASPEAEAFLACPELRRAAA